MKFKFPAQKYFYVNDKLTQTTLNGDYDLDPDSLKYITNENNKEMGKEEIYQYLLDHAVLEKETVVQSHGNSARLSVPKALIGKHVRYWIAILPDINRE